MAKFEIFIKPNALSRIGNARAYDTELSTEAYSKVFNIDKDRMLTSGTHPEKEIGNRR